MFLSDAAHENNNAFFLARSFNVSLMLLRLGSNFYQLRRIRRIGEVDLIMNRFQHGFRSRNRFK